MPKGILVHVKEVLIEAGGAIDVQLILDRLHEKGLVTDGSRKARHHLYTRIFMDISNKGEDSEFRRVGRGVFCLREHVSDTGEATLGTGVRAPGFSGERRCGNCNYLDYSGVQELLQVTGYCSNAEKSSRHYTRKDAEPCDQWKRRNTDKVLKDGTTRQKHQHTVNVFNVKYRGKIGKR